MTDTIDRPLPGPVHYVPRGTCRGKQNPDCPAQSHGTYSAYWRGCRCPHARNDYRLYQKRHREGRDQPRLINAIGTQRRIQALWALGHRSADIGAAIGYTDWHVQRIAACRDYVTHGTWNAIDRAYRALSTTPGASVRTRNRARRMGYAPPLAWDDIDDPAAQPVLDTEPAAEPDTYDPVTVGFAVEGRLTYDQIQGHLPDLIETVRRLARRYGDHEIVQLLRWPGANDPRPDSRTRAQNSLHKFRQRHSIPGREKYEAVYAYGTRSRARKGTSTDKAA